MTSGATGTSPRRRILLFIAVPVLAVLALMSWGLSSAVGSSPDDDFHLSSIWCGHGDAAGCESVPGKPDERTVYRDLVIDSVCFAFNTEASAACHGADFGENPADVVTTPRGNFTGLYPPLYYFTMSLFAGPDIETSVLVMKLFNSVLFVLLVGALFWLLPPHRRRTLLVALAITMVPLGMFVVASTNPSGWAVLSAGTLWIALLGVMESTGRRRVGLGVIALLATIIGAGARADAAIYAAMAVVLVLIMTFRRERGFVVGAALGAVLVAVAVAFYLTSHQGEAASTGLAPGTTGPGDGTGPVVLAIINLINVPALWAGVFGSWNLGWLDTVMPASVWVAGLGIFGGAVFLGLSARVPRKGLAVALVVAALVVIPTALLVQSDSIVGANFQPRYLLPLMVMLAGFVLLTRAGESIATTPVQRWIVIIALSLANSLALQVNIRRYVTGTDVPSVDLDTGAEWWWHLPFSPMTVWIVGSLAFAGILVAINSRIWNEVPVKPAPVTVA